MTRRRICIATGGRAEYGLLHTLMKNLKADDAIELQVVAMAAHVSPAHGETYRLIEADGFEIAAKVPMLQEADDEVGITKSVGAGTIAFADVFADLRPDIMVILGDRFELLAVAVAALLAQIPIAHIHGGEVTEGAVDDAIRHALTKFSTWHFVAAEPYRKRVIQLGEAPERVYNVGAPGLDVLAGLPWLDEAALKQLLGLPLKGMLLLVTYHPETVDVEDPARAFSRLLAALESVPGSEIVITYPNADTHHQRVISLIEAFAARHPGRVRAVRNLGQVAYLSVMRRADAVVGNSSSGLIEAPALKRPTVNVGHRQDGRLKADSVIDVECETVAIIAGIAKALSPEFCLIAAQTRSLYGEGDASGAIVRILKGPMPPRRKSFFDIPHSL